jgi:ubiquinone/menaquinone biosynthesis C-methylase UbiE
MSTIKFPKKVKDHSVTGEFFTLVFDENLQCLKTTLQPSPTNLGIYYESEDYISHTDSKKNFIEKLYHAVRTYSLQQKFKLIAAQTTKRADSAGTILDIGCGTGDFLKTMETNGWDITGFEPNSKAAQIAKSKGLNLMNDLSYVPDNYFDVITMWHVLEHVADLENQIKELHRLIKPNGLIIIAVPNFKSFDATYYKSNWAAFDVPRHLWHFSADSIKHLFGRVGIELLQVKPMYFDSFYVSLLSGKYKNGFTNYVSGFVIGMLSNLVGMFTKEYSSQIYILKRN